MADNEKFEGVWNGEQVSVFREFGGHRFTDEEVEKLLADEYITFPAHSNKTDNDYTAVGKLFKDENTGWVKFKLDFENGPKSVPHKWCGHTFTDEERSALEAGAKVHGTFHSNKTGNDFECDVYWGEEDGERKIIPVFQNSKRG